jgi:hypothetical protein
MGNGSAPSRIPTRLRPHCGHGGEWLPQEKKETAMTDFLLENIKLVILFLLFGSIIGLSHLNAENLAKMKSVLSALKRQAVALRSPPALLHDNGSIPN